MGLNFIRSIAEKRPDSMAHQAFTRYGVGEYEKDPLSIAVSAQGVKLKAGFEYLNACHRFFSYLAEGEVELQGTVNAFKEDGERLRVLGLDFRQLPPQPKKQSFRFEISQRLSIAAYKKLCSEFPSAFLLLNARDSSGRTLKLKSIKPPKIGKPTPGFVTLSLKKGDWPAVAEEFLFDIPKSEREGLSRAEIFHTYIIDKIEIPPGCASPEEARIKAIRKGQILRRIETEGGVRESKIPLEA